MPVMNVGPNSVVIWDSSIFVCHLLSSYHTAAASAVIPHELFDAQVSQILVTKHVLLSLSQIERWMWILRILRHVGRISGATEFARWDELRADKNAWLRAPYHVKAHQSRMGDAYSNCTAFQEVFDSVPCAFHVIPRARSDTFAVATKPST